MRTSMLFCLAAAVLWIVQGTAMAQRGAAPPRDQADNVTPAAKTAELRAEMHRTLADLAEARAAQEPDQAEIERLQQQLGELRGQLTAPRRAAAGECPWGGPGPRGGQFGRGRGGAGAAGGVCPNGRCPNQAAGPAMRAGAGRGYGGPAAGGRGGRGPGYGAGRGAGRGPAAGRGAGGGYGAGAGRGQAW